MNGSDDHYRANEGLIIHNHVMCVYKINKSAQLGELCTYCKLASVDFERNLLDQWFSNWISMTVFL